MDESPLGTGEPRELWAIFQSLCAIPHPSRGEAGLAEWIRGRAQRAGLETAKGAAGNLVIRKPATPGAEDAPGVILQAHLDMVGQAEAGIPHRFDRDPIRPRISEDEPEWLEATGTTLGADNGIGVAAALAFAESKGFRHGPFECLFTVNEEDGMGGARSVDPGELRGSYLINLDHENAGELCIGCAGTVRIRAEFEAEFAASDPDRVGLQLRVGGLRGGHSGADIHLGRANASRVLAELLLSAGEGSSWQLAAFEGGTAANAIPRDAVAQVLLPTSALGRWRSRLDRSIGELTRRHRAADPDLAVTTVELPPAAQALAPGFSSRLLTCLLALPNGLIALDPEVPGAVQSSCNLGIASLKAERHPGLEVLAMVRSSLESEKEAIAAEVETRLRGLGARTTRPASAPAWSPEPDSPLVQRAAQVYRARCGAEPVIMATHGGLECGIFREKFPHWRMISIGPTIRFPHSPKEALLMPSVASFWGFLTSLVEALAREG
ncbi:MAG TPA: beta-Ala-His dipeptidase [Rectinemataceae bacterium]|nr:beta-Ala-His dipeptidase [Rectinemataceae bacterium]